MQRPLILIAQWFGPWPEWIDFFVESCRWNADIDWLIFTDQDPPENPAPNVRYSKTTVAKQAATIGKVIDMDLSHVSPYKLCDLRVCLGLAYAEDLAFYRNYGHCDLDLIFGDIRSFYTDAVLERYEVLSTHADRLSGHLAVLRNNEANRTAFRRIRHWKKKIADASNFGIDEYRFGKALVRPRLLQRLAGARRPVLFEERFTTPMTRVAWLDGTSNHPTRWYWKAGKLTADGYGSREFIYLHFMNWKASTRHRVHAAPAAPWSKLDRIVTMDWRRARSEGFAISHQGVTPLANPFVDRNRELEFAS